jgi:hypothetical protein
VKTSASFSEWYGNYNPPARAVTCTDMHRPYQQLAGSPEPLRTAQRAGCLLTIAIGVLSRNWTARSLATLGQDIWKNSICVDCIVCVRWHQAPQWVNGSEHCAQIGRTFCGSTEYPTSTAASRTATCCMHDAAVPRGWALFDREMALSGLSPCKRASPFGNICLLAKVSLAQS